MLLEFDYKNWRDEDHHYIVDFQVGLPGGGPNGVIEMAHPRDKNGNPIGSEAPQPYISGYVVTRDGKPKGHRRSFDLTKIKELKVYGNH